MRGSGWGVLRGDAIGECDSELKHLDATIGRDELPGNISARAGDDGVDAAAALLLRARRPLVYGLERATVEAQRRAVEITDLIGGVIDPASSASHGASLLAAQRIGQVSATLGELRDRADLIIYWGVDPDVRFPGFRARYVEGARIAGLGVSRRSRGAETARLTVVVDIGDAVGPTSADERIAMDAAVALEALWILRARLRRRRVELERMNPSPQRMETASGAAAGTRTLPPLQSLNRLVTRLRQCRYGVIFHDGDPPRERRDPMVPLALGALAIEANRTARVRLIGVRRPGNAVGAETVLTWQTGFPFAIDFSRGYPRYGPGEFTAERLLARGEVDAALLVGVDTPIDLSDAAVNHLECIPTIVVGGKDAWSGPQTQVRFTTSPFEAMPGSVYRMDGVALPPGRTANPNAPVRRVPDDAAILTRLSEAIRRRVDRTSSRDI